MSEPNYPPHPGTVVMFDVATKTIIEERDAAEMPVSAKYQRTDEGMIPIVRLEFHYHGDQRIIRKYGPNGEYLGAIIQSKS